MLLFVRLQGELNPIMSQYENKRDNGDRPSKIIAQYATNAFTQVSSLTLYLSLLCIFHSSESPHSVYILGKLPACFVTGQVCHRGSFVRPTGHKKSLCSATGQS